MSNTQIRCTFTELGELTWFTHFSVSEPVLCEIFRWAPVTAQSNSTFTHDAVATSREGVAFRGILYVRFTKRYLFGAWSFFIGDRWTRVTAVTRLIEIFDNLKVKNSSSDSCNLGLLIFFFFFVCRSHVKQTESMMFVRFLTFDKAEIVKVKVPR